MGKTVQLVPSLASSRNPDLLVGMSTCDDAGVFRIRPDLALVQTVDFLPPPVDDPVLFGRIAAANSLSDVWAMGGRAVTALNIVCYPDHRIDLDVLAAILRGGGETMDKAGVTLAGGHTMRDEAILYGLSVTGLVHPDRIVTNAGSRPGDRLVLTKPLGSGTVGTAIKQKRCPSDLVDRAVDVMTRLNLPSSEAMLAVGVHAATDVTGFGLVGHASEMSQGAGVDIILHAPAVPVLEGVRELIDGGVGSTVAFTVAGALGKRLRLDPALDTATRTALLDAQTSGGLLISVPPERTDDLLAALREGNAPESAVVGEVRKPGPEGPGIEVKT